MQNIILTKESSNEEIKSYFLAILELSKADNDFPVNLDDVWPLVYSRKEEAVRALSKNFLENIDYQPLRQNAERSKDGKFSGENKITYHLTLSCMEFFIARKVRPVFEVYRKVFHGVAQGSIAMPKPKPSQAEIMEWTTGVTRLLGLNKHDTVRMLVQAAPDKADIGEFVQYATRARAEVGLCDVDMYEMLKGYADKNGLPMPVNRCLIQPNFYQHTAPRMKYLDPKHLEVSHTLYPAGVLLERFNHHTIIKKKDFDNRMIKLGLMAEASVVDFEGQPARTEKYLTEEGELYGENTKTMWNGNPILPMYYEDTFIDLLTRIGILVMYKLEKKGGLQ